MLKGQWKTFVLWSVLALLLLLVRIPFKIVCILFSVTYIEKCPPFLSCAPQVPLVAVDSYFYGKLVIAPLNILLYNVFTPHGPDLYGMFMFILLLV